MRTSLIPALIVSCLFAASLAQAGQVAISSEQNAPEISVKKCGDFTSAELALAVAQTLSRRTAEQVVNRGAATEGVLHKARLFHENYFYEVDTSFYWNGTKYLTISAYLTNRDFSELRSSTDAVAEELSMGAPLVHFEQYFYDRGIDGTAEVYQEFTKKRGPVYEGFTRRERDLGKKAGVSEYVQLEDRAYRDGKKLNLKKEEPQDVAETYSENLATIANLLGFCGE